MGDRGNIAIVQWDSTAAAPRYIVFYAHWGGYTLPQTLASGIAAAKERWGDTPYFARIVFNELQGEDRGLTGFGISDRLEDNEYPVFVVNDRAETVMLVTEDAFRNETDLGGDEAALAALADKPFMLGKWTFDEFVNVVERLGDKFWEIEAPHE